MEAGLLVIDRGPSDSSVQIPVIQTRDLAQLAELAASVPARPTAQVRVFRVASNVAFLEPKKRALATPAGCLAFLGSASSIAYRNACRFLENDRLKQRETIAQFLTRLSVSSTACKGAMASQTSETSGWRI